MMMWTVATHANERVIDVTCYYYWTQLFINGARSECFGLFHSTGKDKDAKTKPLPGEKVTTASDITARLVFEAPSMVRWSRHDKEGNTNFISAFYLMPAGFGKTRFMSR